MNPPRNRKSEDGTPPPTTGATELYPDHVRICGRLGAKFPGPTRQFPGSAVIFSSLINALIQNLAPIGSERGFWQFSPWFIKEVSLLEAPLGALSPNEPASGVLWFVPEWEQSGL